MRTRVLFAALIAANILAWIWAFAAFADHPALLGTGLLAWVFGLRHALDADHIAAIDNVVRRLPRSGRSGGLGPAGTGLWFSLGHSSIVIAAAGALAVGAAATKGTLPALARAGAVLGTAVSGLFLLAIAAMNLWLLRDIWRTLRRARAGEPAAALDTVLAGGPLARLLRPLLAAIDAPWRMYPIGVLFGLGFDTATEIGLLAIAAGAAMGGMTPWQTMVFPALFTAGMTLLDSADSALMVGAYGWAFADPLRKLWYNLTMTVASVLVAVFVSLIETLGLIGGAWHLDGPLWGAVAGLNDNMSAFGLTVIAMFATCWAVSALLYRRLAPQPNRAAGP